MSRPHVAVVAMDGFMGRNYNRSIFKHLEETLAKFDALEREFNTYKQKAEQELFECRAKIADLESALIQKDEQIALLEAERECLQRLLIHRGISVDELGGRS